MTIWPHDSTKETGWRNTEEPRTSCSEIFSTTNNIPRITRLLQIPIKQLKPFHASLWDLLPSDILVDIDIWLSGLKHRDKFKHKISRFKPMCNPVLFEIPHKLWTLYHNFGALRCYNKVRFDWAHIFILSRDNSHWTHYEYYPNKPE